MYKKLYVSLMVLRDIGKYLHASAKGESFYGDHLFTDRVIENISNYTDSMIEICFLGGLELPPYPKGYYALCASLCPEYTDDEEEYFKRLFAFVEETLNGLNEMVEKEGDKISLGQANLLGVIAEDLTRTKGLLWRRIQ